MWRRKIQLVAGSAYSITLPIEWIKKTGLKEKNEVLVLEKNDRTLSISPTSLEEKRINGIDLELEEYPENINQIIHAVYYIGIEKITINSKKEIDKETRMKIRHTLQYLSGTEISYEDKHKIVIYVLIDKSKIDIIQALYRISLIIDDTLLNLIEKINIEEIEINENEIDRLYHLTSKIISTALTDQNVLTSSRVSNISLVLSLFLISKRMENLGDSLYRLSKYINDSKITLKSNEMEVLKFVKAELPRAVKFLLKLPESKIFIKALSSEQKEIKKLNEIIKDRVIGLHLNDAMGNLLAIEEELVDYSFYRKLILEKVL